MSTTPQLNSYINLAYHGKNTDYKFEPYVHQHPDGDYGVSIHGLTIYMTIEQMQTLHACLDTAIRQHEQKETEKVADGSPFSDHAIGYLAPTAAITQEAIDEPSHPVEHPADDEEVFF